LADPVLGSGIQKSQECEIIESARARNAPGWRKDPPWQPAVVEPQLPALPSRQIGKGERAFLRAYQLLFGADRLEKGDGGMIARKKQMMAIVDAEPWGWLEVGAAAATRVASQFVHDDTETGRRKSDSSRQAGETGPDDMNGSVRLQNKPWRRIGQ